MTDGPSPDAPTPTPAGAASTLQQARPIGAVLDKSPPPPRPHRASPATLMRRFVAAWGLHLVLGAGSFILLLPFIWMVLTSLKPLSQVNDSDWIPRPQARLQVGQAVNQLKGPRQLIRRLAAGEGPVMGYLHKTFSEDFIHALKPGKAPTLDEQKSLAGQLNRVIDGDVRLDTLPAFGGVELSRGARNLADRTQHLASQARIDKSPQLSAQLHQARALTNRRVLHDALPDLIPGPRTLQWHNYLAVFFTIPFARYYWNSIFVASWVTFLQVFTSSLAAFSFARLRWPGRDKVFVVYLSTMMLPGLVMMIPNFQIMISLHLIDTLTGLILPAAFTAFGTFLLRQFMLSIPVSLDEAAEIDGASKWRIYWDVILPLARPGLVTLAIFTFMGNYQSFFWPLVMLKSQYKYTLPIGMLYFDSSYGQMTNQLMAAVTMSVLPMIVVFVALQKQLVKGIQLGAVKG